MKAIKVYKEIGYRYMVMPDHVPLAENDPGSLQSFGLLLWLHSWSYSVRQLDGLSLYNEPDLHVEWTSVAGRRLSVQITWLGVLFRV